VNSKGTLFGFRILPAAGRIRNPNSVPLGFTLIEVMAAVAILGIGLVSLILAINRAKDTAYITRSLKAVRNLSTNLLAEIESGRIENLYDGMGGDFSSEGYPEFHWEIGIGDESVVPTAAQDLRTEEERRRDEQKALDKQKSESEPSGQSAESSSTQATYEQVTVRVSFKSLAEQPSSFVLVKRISSDIVNGKFKKEENQNSNASSAPK